MGELLCGFRVVAALLIVALLAGALWLVLFGDQVLPDGNEDE